MPQQLLDAQKANSSSQGSTTSVLMTRGSNDELVSQSKADSTADAFRAAGTMILSRDVHDLPSKDSFGSSMQTSACLSRETVNAQQHKCQDPLVFFTLAATAVMAATLTHGS